MYNCKKKETFGNAQTLRSDKPVDFSAIMIFLSAKNQQFLCQKQINIFQKGQDAS